MLRLAGREKNHQSRSAKGRFPVLLCPWMHICWPYLKWTMDELWLPLLTACWMECQCQGKRIVSLVPAPSHEIKVTWRFLSYWLVTISFPWVLPAGLIIVLNNGSISQHDNSFWSLTTWPDFMPIECPFIKPSWRSENPSINAIFWKSCVCPYRGNVPVREWVLDKFQGITHKARLKKSVLVKIQHLCSRSASILDFHMYQL